MEKNKPLTKAEYQIMDVLWNMPGQSGFISEILNAIPYPKPAYTTLATFLKIMKKKGFVDSDMVNKTLRFTPLISRDEYTRYFMNNVKDTYFGGSLVSLVSFFAEKEKLTDEEADELIRLIKKNKS